MIVNKIEDKDITLLKISDEIVNDKNVIGSFVKNNGTLEILNLNHKYDSLLNTDIEIQNFGTWHIDDLKTDEDFTISTLNISDVAYKFDADYQYNFSFPNTLGAWATWIGEQVGIHLKGIFLNYDLVLNEHPFLGNKPSWRDAVKLIAKYASSFVRKNYDNTYSILWFENKITEIEDWESFVHGKSTKPINIIILSTGSTEDNVRFPEIIPQDPHELRIEDDWENINRFSINEAIYNQVSGFFYTPISKLEVPFGLLELRPGQKIKTQDIEHQKVETFLTKLSLEWQGGDFNDKNAWNTSIMMEELSETTTKYVYSSSIQNAVIRTERKANKNAGLIEDVVEKTSEYELRITKTEQDIDGISQKVENTYDFTRTSQSKNKLILNQCEKGPLVNFKISGNFELTYLSDETYLSEETFLTDSFLIVEGESEKLRIELPIDYLYQLNEVSDELVLERIYNEELKEYESKIKVIRRIEIVNGTKVIASKEKNEELGFLEVNLFKGKNSVYFESFETLNYYAKYVIINDITGSFVTELQMNSSINQTAEEISQEVSKKVDNVEYNSYKKQTSESISQKVAQGEVVSEINQSKDLIEIKGNRFVVESKNFTLTKEGIASIKEAIIEGKLVGGSIQSRNYKSNEAQGTYIDLDNGELISFSGFNFRDNSTYRTNIQGRKISTTKIEVINDLDGNIGTLIEQNGIKSGYYGQLSLVEKKKNFELYLNGLNEIVGSDIYKYNMKNEKENNKKHIGLVIGENYKISKEVISENNDNVDLYSMISIAWQAIKELNEIITKQQVEIEQLKERNDANVVCKETVEE